MSGLVRINLNMSVAYVLLGFLITPVITVSGEEQIRNSDYSVVSAPADVSISGSRVNSVPVPGNDVVYTDEDTFVNIDVLANDTDIDGDSLNVTSRTPARNGTSNINANNNTITYTPNVNFYGTDTFNYTVSDGKNDTSAQVAVTVRSINDKPNAVDDRFPTTIGVSANIDVLANDTDVDGDPLILTNLTRAANGTAMVNETTNTITYTPTPDFIGEDTFEYTLLDGNKNGSDTGTVTVKVSKVLERVSKFIGSGERGVGVDPATNAIINIFFEGPSPILEDDHASVFILGSLGAANGSALSGQIVTVSFCNKDNEAFCYYSGNLKTDDVGRYEFKPENGDINLDKGTYIAFVNATADVYEGRLNATKELIVQALPPSIPSEIWGAFSALIVGFLVPSAVSWGNGWRQRKNLREYVGRVDNARNNPNMLHELENKILIELEKNRISQSHYELIKARIDGYIESSANP